MIDKMKLVSFTPNIAVLRKALSIIRIKKLRSTMFCDKELERALMSKSDKTSLISSAAEKMPDIDKKLNDAIAKVLPFFDLDQYDLSEKELINDIRFCRYAYGFQPDEYLCFGFMNKSAEERTEFISDIERFIFTAQMNDLADSYVFQDKYITYERFKRFYKREIISVEYEKDFRAFSAFVDSRSSFVLKKVNLSRGASVRLVTSPKSENEKKRLFYSIIKEGRHVLEEKIQQGEAMKAFNPSSVNTIRCIVCRTNHGVKVLSSFVKVGRNGSFVDNGGAGGILAAIDYNTGMIFTDGADENLTWYKDHPDSHIVFKGFVMPDWEEVKTICNELSSVVPSVRSVGWDLAYSENGWVVVEGNDAGQFIVPQLTEQRGIKAELKALMSDMDLMA